MSNDEGLPPAQGGASDDGLNSNTERANRYLAELFQEVTRIVPLQELVESFTPLDQTLSVEELMTERTVRKGISKLAHRTRLQNEMNALDREFSYRLPDTMNIQTVLLQLGVVSGLLATVTKKMGDTKLYMERTKKRRLTVYRASFRVASGTVKEKEAYAEEVATNSLQDTEFEMAQDKTVKVEGIFNSLEIQFTALRKMAGLIDLETRLNHGVRENEQS